MRTRWKFPFALLCLALVAGVVWAENSPAGDGPATQGVGLIRNDPGALVGYTLLSPLQSTSTFLIDMNGRVVKTWLTDTTPSSLAYLRENGNLLRAGLPPDPPFGKTAGGGGKMQEFDWDGNLVWDFPTEPQRKRSITISRACRTEMSSCW